jgi:hypothetical protein
MTNPNGRFGIHGGQYIPETLMNAVIELEEAYNNYKNDPEFNRELTELLNEYAPLFLKMPVCRDSPLSQEPLLTARLCSYHLLQLILNACFHSFRMSVSSNTIIIYRHFIMFGCL